MAFYDAIGARAAQIGASYFTRNVRLTPYLSARLLALKCAFCLLCVAPDSRALRFVMGVQCARVSSANTFMELASQTFASDNGCNAFSHSTLLTASFWGPAVRNKNTKSSHPTKKTCRALSVSRSRKRVGRLAFAALEPEVVSRHQEINSVKNSTAGVVIMFPFGTCTKSRNTVKHVGIARRYFLTPTGGKGRRRTEPHDWLISKQRELVR